MKQAIWVLAAWCMGALLAHATLAVDAGQRNAAEPQGDPVFDPPTLHCLGAYWLVRGDDNRNARVEVHFRKAGTQDWQRAPDMLRVIHGPFSDEGDHIKNPAVPMNEGWMFAGSVLFLDEGTQYEVKYNLIDPDGGSTEKILAASTRAEPVAPAEMRIRHVVPGNGGGSGTEADPFKGLTAADADAQPGDLFMVHKGTYDGPFHVTHDGEEGKPIIWRGAGDGEAIIDGHSQVGPPPGFKMDGKVVQMAEEAPPAAPGTGPAKKAAKRDKGEQTLKGRHDVWLENLTICNGLVGVWLPDAQRIVIRRCHIHHIIEGIFANVATDAKQGYFFIADNLLEGVTPWPTTQEEWEAFPETRGIWISGKGNIACYNRIRHWKDGMDVDESPQCVGCDFHNNDVSECFDDGCEMDGSDRNNRNYNNRYCNSLTGVSLQPTHGGPVYVYRNVMYNTQTEAFKLHNDPSGSIMFQNTCVKNNGPLLMCWTARSIDECHAWNNLYLGYGSRAVDYDDALFDCTFDYDGFGGFGNFKDKEKPVFMKWAVVMYKTLDDVRAKSPYESHCVIVDPKTAFASGLEVPQDHLKDYDNTIVDMRLKEGCAAIGAGQIVPGYQTGPDGKAPSLGACEFGQPLPHYGPREEK